MSIQDIHGVVQSVITKNKIVASMQAHSLHEKSVHLINTSRFINESLKSDQ